MKLAIVLVLALVAVAAAQECNLECADCVNATGCTPCNRNGDTGGQTYFGCQAETACVDRSSTGGLNLSPAAQCPSNTDPCDGVDCDAILAPGAVCHQGQCMPPCDLPGACDHGYCGRDSGDPDTFGTCRPPCEVVVCPKPGQDQARVVCEDDLDNPDLAVCRLPCETNLGTICANNGLACRNGDPATGEGAGCYDPNNTGGTCDSTNCNGVCQGDTCEPFCDAVTCDAGFYCDADAGACRPEDPCNGVTCGATEVCVGAPGGANAFLCVSVCSQLANGCPDGFFCDTTSGQCSDVCGTLDCGDVPCIFDAAGTATCPTSNDPCENYPCNAGQTCRISPNGQVGCVDACEDRCVGGASCTAVPTAVTDYRCTCDNPDQLPVEDPVTALVACIDPPNNDPCDNIACPAGSECAAQQTANGVLAPVCLCPSGQAVTPNGCVNNVCQTVLCSSETHCEARCTVETTTDADTGVFITTESCYAACVCDDGTEPVAGGSCRDPPTCTGNDLVDEILGVCLPPCLNADGDEVPARDGRCVNDNPCPLNTYRPAPGVTNFPPDFCGRDCNGVFAIFDDINGQVCCGFPHTNDGVVIPCCTATERYDRVNRVCVSTCPDGTDVRPDGSCPSPCPSGAYVTPSGDCGYPCPDGTMVADPNACTCPNNRVADRYTGECVEPCADGSRPHNGFCEPICATGDLDCCIASSADGTCVRDCDPGQGLDATGVCVDYCPGTTRVPPPSGNCDCVNIAGGACLFQCDDGRAVMDRADCCDAPAVYDADTGRCLCPDHRPQVGGRCDFPCDPTAVVNTAGSVLPDCPCPTDRGFVYDDATGTCTAPTDPNDCGSPGLYFFEGRCVCRGTNVVPDADTGACRCDPEANDACPPTLRNCEGHWGFRGCYCADFAPMAMSDRSECRDDPTIPNDDDCAAGSNNWRCICHNDRVRNGGVNTLDICLHPDPCRNAPVGTPGCDKDGDCSPRDPDNYCSFEEWCRNQAAAGTAPDECRCLLGLDRCGFTDPPEPVDGCTPADRDDTTKPFCYCMSHFDAAGDICYDADGENTGAASNRPSGATVEVVIERKCKSRDANGDVIASDDDRCEIAEPEVEVDGDRVSAIVAEVINGVRDEITIDVRPADIKFNRRVDSDDADDGTTVEGDVDSEVSWRYVEVIEFKDLNDDGVYGVEDLLRRRIRFADLTWGAPVRTTEAVDGAAVEVVTHVTATNAPIAVIIKATVASAGYTRGSKTIDPRSAQWDVTFEYRDYADEDSRLAIVAEIECGSPDNVATVADADSKFVIDVKRSDDDDETLYRFEVDDTVRAGDDGVINVDRSDVIRVDDGVYRFAVTPRAGALVRFTMDPTGTSGDASLTISETGSNSASSSVVSVLVTACLAALAVLFF